LPVVLCSGKFFFSVSLAFCCVCGYEKVNLLSTLDG
jgi:hypothetical protein